MWIRTQNKQRIINSDHVADVFIDKTGTKIYAESTFDRDFFILGEYGNRDTSLKVLGALSVIIGSDIPTAMTMPLGGEVDEWCKSIEELATAYIAKDFRV